MKVPGVILLEIIIATAIAAVLSTILFTSVTQIGRGIAASYERILFNERSMLFFRQWQLDFNGAFVPYVAKKEEEKKLPATSAPSAQQQPAQPKKQQLEPLGNYFIAKAGEKNIQSITFVTTNPLPTYNVAKQRMVRVTYSLELEQGRKDSYRLMRQETENIENPEKTTGSNYMLLDGVKELSLEFVTMVSEQKEQGKEPEKKDVTVRKWPAKELEGKTSLLLPHTVITRLVLWDSNYKRDHVIACRFPIYAIEEKAAAPMPSQAKPAAAEKVTTPAPTAPGGKP